MADALPAPAPDVPDIIRQYLNGTPVKDLAASAGVAIATIYNWIHDESADPHIVRKVLITRFARAEQKIEEATDQLSLARARELNNNAKWHLERAVRQFNPKSEVVSDNTIRVIIQPPPSVIDVKARRIKELEESKTHAPQSGATGQEKS